MRVLIIEDSHTLADTLAEAFNRNKIEVDYVYDGESGYECAASGIYDLIILDLMLPKMSGHEVIRKIRNEDIDTPIIILTAKSELSDKIELFNLGADDYVTKPFEIEELIVRAQAIVRRRGKNNIIELKAGNIGLDVNNLEMKNIKTGKTMRIAKKEMQLMEMFLYNKNQVLGKELITTKIWGYDSNAEYNNVEVYVSFLRRKLNHLQADISISVVRGIGYRLEEK